MNKKIFAIITLSLVGALLLTACGSAEKLMEYELGDDKAPSINAVVGETRKVSGVSTGTDNGVQYKQYTYESASVTEDLAVYFQHLQDNGWIATKNYDLSTVTGEAQFGTASVESGKILIISASFEQGKYAIRFNKLEGELLPN